MKQIKKYIVFLLSVFSFSNFLLADQNLKNDQNIIMNDFHDQEIFQLATNLSKILGQYCKNNEFLDDLLIFCEENLKTKSNLKETDLVEVISELISLYLLKTQRAIRPDAPNSSDGSPVGSFYVLDCNDDQIFDFIAKIRKFFNQCCNNIQINFSGTFTVLNALIEDFAGTFTVYNEISETLLTNFNGTLTALEACCEADEVDLSGIFTVLSSINNTIVTEFTSLFTAIDTFCEINQTDMSGVFTSLTNIQETLTVNFNGTFTILEIITEDFISVFTFLSTIESTLANGFDDTFTSLNACCQTISTDFNGIFTVLNSLNVIIESDFNGTFTSLNIVEQELNGTFTTINALEILINTDFNNVYTQLNACCSQQSADFSGVFTTMENLENELVTDFNSLFTALSACCAAKTNDFIGVFTALNATNELLIEDFNASFTTIQAIQNDFDGTFTVINELETVVINDFNGTFTAINSCCQAITLDFNALFTALADIKNTLTSDFNGTFTALAGYCQAISADFNGVFTTIDVINETLENDFNGSFTIIASIKGSACNSISITEPVIITVPGSYCLANDLIGTLTIAADNVTLNLNFQVIRASDQIGIFINGGNNATVTNGTLLGTSIGIEIANTNTVNLNNLLIENCSDTGILINPTCRAITLYDLVVDTAVNSGVNFVNNNDDSVCQRVTIRNCGGSFGLGTAGSISNSFFEDCAIIDSFVGLPIYSGVNIAQGNNNQIRNSSTTNIQNIGGSVQSFNIGSNNSVLDSCVTLSLISSTNGSGYAILGQNITVENCFAIGLQSGVGSFGFVVSGTNCALNNCYVQTVTQDAGVTDGAGYFVSGSEINILNCQSNSMNLGFQINSSSVNSMLLNCSASNSIVDGFLLNAASTVVGYCTSFNNRGFGFNVFSSAIPMYGCFATGNTGGNYSGAAPFVQPASQNTTVFARGNNFI